MDESVKFRDHRRDLVLKSKAACVEIRDLLFKVENNIEYIEEHINLDLQCPNTNISRAANGTFEIIEQCVDIKRALGELKDGWNE